MYEDFYSLKQAPFRESTDPGLIFLSEKLKQTLVSLLSCFQNQSGHALLSGDEGVGKSIYMQTVVKNLSSNTLCAYLVNPIEHSEQLVMNICQAFEVHANGSNSKHGYVIRLHALMDQLSERNQHAVLIIDNAQNLREDILEEIYLLMEYEPVKGPCLQFCLIGRPELQDVLNQPRLYQLNEMLVQRFHVSRLSPEETNAYIRHRLHAAGYEMVGDLFNDAAVQSIYSYTNGLPRQINQLCEHALTLGGERGINEIDAELIHEAHAIVFGGQAQPMPMLQESAAYEQDGQAAHTDQWLDDPDVSAPEQEQQHFSSTATHGMNDRANQAYQYSGGYTEQNEQPHHRESDRFFQNNQHSHPDHQQTTMYFEQVAQQQAPPQQQASSKNVTISNRVLETIIARTQRRVERYFRDKYILIKKPEPGLWLPLVFVFLLGYLVLFLLTAAVLRNFITF